MKTKITLLLVASFFLVSFVKPPLPGDTKSKVLDKSYAGQSVEQVVYQLYGKNSRDKFFNPKRKVEFESELAVLLIEHYDIYRDELLAVSKKIYEYIDKKCNSNPKKINKELLKLFTKNKYMGRIADSIVHEKKYVEQVKNILSNGKGSLANHFLLQLLFMDKIYTSDYEHGIAKQILGNSAIEPKFMRKKKEVAPFFENRGRFRPQHEKSTFKVFFPQGNKNHDVLHGIKAETDYSIASEFTTEYFGLHQFHSRGMEYWTLDESNPFVQEARIKWNMPLACSISGTVAEMLACLHIFGFSDFNFRQTYITGLTGFLIAIGAHSFHEIMMSAKAGEIPYQKGNYRGVFCRELYETSAYKNLQKKYPDLIG